jgi:hypothetical protein
VDLSLVDDERQGITAVCADALDDFNALVITWLDKLRSSTPVRELKWVNICIQLR